MATFDGFSPYPPEFVARYRALGYWEDRTLATFFADTCARYAQRTALVAGNERISYYEMGQRAEHLALHLLAQDIQPLDRFVMQLPNIPECIYLYIALQYIGAIPIMALPAHGYTEISQFARLGEAVGYAFSPALGENESANIVQQVQRENPQLRLFLIAGKASLPSVHTFDELLSTKSEMDSTRLTSIVIDPLHPAVFQLSGGTTGMPKLIPRTHNDYLYNSHITAAINDIAEEDALLIALPIAHNFPLACPGVQGFLMHGARCVLSPSHRTDAVFSLIQREKITHLALVPSLLIRYINDPLLQAYDLSSLRIITVGGQKLQPEVKRRTEVLLPSCKVQEVFGMAEGLLCYVRLDDDDQLRIETTGRPMSLDDEIRLVDEENKDVAPGEVGELLVRGPYTIRGYFRAPEHNARAFTADGFYRTGDLMRLHPSGNYIVEGRKKDLINRGGEKISAEEIENLLLTHPAIVNVACVPMPDPTLGERVCAFVILKAGYTLTLDDLVAFLKGKGIAYFKYPEWLELVEEFPLSPFGKVSKQILVQQISKKVA